MLEIADIVREAGRAYRQRYGPRLLPSHERALRDIEQCRTPARGGHRHQCDRCGEVRYSYHSCRNRHCPKCHADQEERWVEALRIRLLPGPYYLLTFTLPPELLPTAFAHQREVYSILLRCAAQSLLAILADPQHLGAEPAILAVLHTWTRDLRYHPHAHLLVTAGGLASDDTWVEPRRPTFLVPARALSVVFRAKVRDAFTDAGLAHGISRRAWRRKWVVHCQHAGDGERTVAYLARYVFRVAITNRRLERFENGRVTFRYRDRRSGKSEHRTLAAESFLHLFLQHVLPAHFTKVRYYGLMSPAARPKLERARHLLAAHRPRPPPPPAATRPHAERPTCPACGEGEMRVVETLPPRFTARTTARAPP